MSTPAVLATCSWGKPVRAEHHGVAPTVVGCSIVVCTSGRAAALQRLLRSIAAQDFEIDRLVLVDASPDRRTEQMLQDSDVVDGLATSSLYFRVTDPLRGLTRQRNFGTGWVRTDLVVFFDDDVVLEPGCLEALVSAHRSDDRVVGAGAVATNLLARPSWLWRTRAALRLVANLRPGTYHRSGMSVPWSFLEPCVAGSDGDWLPGCAMMWRTAVVLRERFNETFAGYAQGEDTEFSLRARRHGVLRIVGGARVLHLRESTGRPNASHAGHMTMWNKYRTHRDCLPDRRRIDVAWFAYAWTVDTLLLLRFLADPRAWRERSSELGGRLRAGVEIIARARRGPAPEIAAPAGARPGAPMRGRLVVVSHKDCWRSAASSSGYATTGGFPLQVAALAELFDETVLCVPVRDAPGGAETNPVIGPRLRVVELDPLPAAGLHRRLRTLTWTPRNAVRLAREIRGADVVHAPIPSDVASFALVLAPLLRRRLLVRYCGGWAQARTLAERAWMSYMRRRAQSRDVMVATGSPEGRAASDESSLRWIFATTLHESQLDELARRAKTTHRSGVVTAGRQVNRKGTEQAVRALRLLHDWGMPVTLDVVGGGDDLPRLGALVRDLRLSEHVVFHGELAHGRLLERLLAAEVFVLPTRVSEGFPKVVVEALACGLPVVSPLVPAFESASVRASGVGVIVDPSAPSAIATATRDLLSDAPRLARLREAAPTVVRGLSLERWRDTLGSFMAEAWPELVRHPSVDEQPR